MLMMIDSDEGDDSDDGDEIDDYYCHGRVDYSQSQAITRGDWGLATSTDRLID